MKILDGKKLAAEILEQVNAKIAQLDSPLGLAIILVGQDPSSHLYVKLKQRACEKCGIAFHKYLFAENAAETEIIKTIKFLNNDPQTTGIMVQLPLPTNFDQQEILSAIKPEKDVDHLCPANWKKLKHGAPFIISPMARGIEELIKSADENLSNKKIFVLANSPYLSQEIQHLFPECATQHMSLEDKDWESPIETADIVIVSLGRPGFLKNYNLKKGAVIIDVGINKDKDGKIIGDVDTSQLENKAACISPVPGGVGPMTIAMLLDNLLFLKSCFKMGVQDLK